MEVKVKKVNIHHKIFMWYFLICSLISGILTLITMFQGNESVFILVIFGFSWLSFLIIETKIDGG